MSKSDAKRVPFICASKNGDTLSVKKPKGPDQASICDELGVRECCYSLPMLNGFHDTLVTSGEKGFQKAIRSHFICLLKSFGPVWFLCGRHRRAEQGGGVLRSERCR